jgi:NAD(P)-dependent dehydrogenase (short-subunit alcohol dehydrogenase family)
LVTGASSGIGAATAQLLAREGADVALLARGDGLAIVGDRVSHEGGRAVQLRADVADREALETAIDAGIESLGGLDVVVVGAAAGAFGRFAEMPARDFDRCMAVTFGGAVDTIRAVLPHLERSRGRLVVIGSAADSIALSLLSPYVAAKHALDGFVEALRAELRSEESRISVSLVRPGPVDSPFWRHLTHPAGLTPPELPPLSSYSVEAVARAVVACAIAPRSTVTVGGTTVMLELLNAVARPAMRRVLSLTSRLGRSHAHGDPAPNALWEPSGDGTVEGGLRGRPSMLAAARLGCSRPESGGLRHGGEAEHLEPPWSCA